MSKRVVGFVVCSALVLSGCATGRMQLTAAKGCADWRWIAIKKQAAAKCPIPADGWKQTQLFAPAEATPYPTPRGPYYGQQPPARGPQSPDTDKALEELQRFCVYQTAAVPGGKPRQPPFASAAAGGLERLDRDCAVISGSALGPPLAAMSEQFLSQAGRSQGGPPATAAPLQISRQPTVRLAFLDTQPTGRRVPDLPAKAGERPTSLHGYTLAHIAHHLVCSGKALESCAAQITTRLALPIRRFDPTSMTLTERDDESDGEIGTRGGVIGTQGDLATAIFAEVRAWQTDPPPPGAAAPQHLVLNLSVGWDPQLIDGLDKKQLAELRAGTQAVYGALRYASTLNVLVLAAAGNRNRCSWCAKGPLLPAAWERDRPAGETPQLIYAVGGVRSNGKPLRNARRRSMPPRTAYGENAVVTTSDPDHTTWLYTGSSVATAVVSSTAAVVWDSVPGLSPAGVMKILYDSGDPLGFHANFWSGGGTAPESHRVSLCTAVKAACDANSSPSCPTIAQCPAWKRKVPAFPSWSSQWWVAGACHPWVGPQPPDPPCPPCDPGGPPR